MVIALAIVIADIQGAKPHVTILGFPDGGLYVVEGKAGDLVLDRL